MSASNTFGDAPRGTTIADIDREAHILSNLSHENIVELHEVFHEDDSVVLILDLVTGGELFARVAECERLSEEEASNFVQQILLGVQHMHSSGVVHLDLKPENIMIEDLASRKIKIIDFGLARQLHPNESLKDMAGTPEFCAPELINYDPITLATDMWAIGVITYILLTGISPFAGDTQLETFQNILDCVVDYSREEMKDTTGLAKDFIRRLLIKVPRKRSTVNDCLQHPWIKPSNVTQQNYRRGSLIKKQNLDGLRHFIASPSPPSSPAEIHSTLNADSHGFFQNPVLDLEEEDTSPRIHVADEPPGKVEDVSVRTDNDYLKREGTMTGKHENTNFETETPEIISEMQDYSEIRSSLPASIVSSLRKTDSFDPMSRSVVHDSLDSSSTPKAVSMVDTKQTPTHSNKHAAGGWRSNFGSGLMGKLGAAFASATIHSTHQPAVSHSPGDGKIVHHKVNKTTSTYRDGEVVHHHRVHNKRETNMPERFNEMTSSVYSQFGRKISSESGSSVSVDISEEMKVMRTPRSSRGSVFKTVEGYETQETGLPHHDDHDGRNGFLRKVWNNSYSITERAQHKMWNVKSIGQVANSEHHRREPDRARVGRLQAMFEAHPPNRLKQSNGQISSSQRFGQT